MLSKSIVAASLVAYAAAAYENTTEITTVTHDVVVTEFTTYCPEPTTFITNSQTITVTEPTTLTITDCPCTIKTTQTCSDDCTVPTNTASTKASPPVCTPKGTAAPSSGETETATSTASGKKTPPQCTAKSGEAPGTTTTATTTTKAAEGETTASGKKTPPQCTAKSGEAPGTTVTTKAPETEAPGTTVTTKAQVSTTSIASVETYTGNGAAALGAGLAGVFIAALL
ncbi:Spi1p CYBJADRAFT_72855 [Cyberlindnera jadinii NRRL Y-1542]|uniref:Uncharacterized protein n=1 Tax=Cyberlindnera jadinii (strain ATCC 18201 / CBS 1600 / BCRC 20928 / JCM 3617 / NBRC 0987 / NRRL Y-1542) TaxID=983966 RepID=A0A1E4S4D5_CYBJN|nr:hypothetical protein CYBJADRAFT_72855 [Cyberlindnera jadinii NRRL Y-1542]ODV74374.1 hypothetical protein CYBJADRAFT_72855 [Cyberlindnera jadinii NRRL Y-1542]